MGYFQGATEEWKKTYPDQSVDYPDGGFVVVAGTLGPSVGVFTGCALSCVLLLAARRHFLGGELGATRHLRTPAQHVWLPCGSSTSACRYILKYSESTGLPVLRSRPTN